MTAPKYDKSNLMKSAWNMFKAGKKYRNHVLTFAECLKEAWKAEKTRFIKAMDMYTLWNKAAEEQRKRDAGRNIGTCSMSFMAGTLVDYYASNRYNGD